MKWLDAPDPSKNYDSALEKHQENTCSWFIYGQQFDDWKNNELPFIWVDGIRKREFPSISEAEC